MLLIDRSTDSPFIGRGLRAVDFQSGFCKADLQGVEKDEKSWSWSDGWKFVGDDACDFESDPTSEAIAWIGKYDQESLSK